jgi:ATP-binding cassette subfamily B protein
MMLSANAVVRGEQTIGDFVLIHLFLIQLSQPLAFIGGVYREIRQSLTDIEVLFGLLETPAEITDSPNARDLTVPSGAIRFNDVHFHYADDRPILRGISFDVPAGKTVAIVGQSGAGKSTISRLLCRFYDVTAGSISLMGRISGRSRQQAFVPPLAWCRKTLFCSMTRLAITFIMGIWMLARSGLERGSGCQD